MEELEIKKCDSKSSERDGQKHQIETKSSFEKNFDWSSSYSDQDRALFNESLKEGSKGRSNDTFYFV